MALPGSYRIKCPHCGQVQDVIAPQPCNRCHIAVAPLNQGMMQLYRMGSPIGIAVGYGITIDGQPFGHLANKESVRYSIPYGTHTLHITCGATRRCRDITFTLTPEVPNVFLKARIKMGFWTNTMLIEFSTPDQMPPIY